MHFDDSEKPGRKAALEALKTMIGGMRADKLGSLKKPSAVAIEVGDDDDKLGAMDDDADVDDGTMPAGGDEPSDEEKAQIAELYHKFCK